jgi:hypothetical protein
MDDDLFHGAVFQRPEQIAFVIVTQAFVNSPSIAGSREIIVGWGTSWAVIGPSRTATLASEVVGPAAASM